MTDRPDTQQDLEMTLATIQEQIATAIDPTLLTEGARARLGEMYTTAEQQGDQDACLAIQKAWDDISTLAVDTVRAREAALTAMDINKTVTSQRDAALKEHADLIDDLENVNLDNPMIRSVHSEGVDSAFEDFDGFHTECPGCDCFNNGHLPQIDHDGVNIVISALMGHWGELSPKRTRQLTRFVNTFGRLLYDEERYEDEDGDGDEE